MSDEPSQAKIFDFCQLSQRESPWQQVNFADRSKKSERNGSFAKASLYKKRFPNKKFLSIIYY